ncbi:S8 family peptidase [Pseudobacillus badius]|uniref:S8 family peptidase n=1 Tax=Bacillus badius TaxID=1455 RepID=UPI0007BBB4C3|nr:S8 family serine peptidase [Bacillus badius]KZR57566.1 hypothetical protein A3781_01920 [Bacillus badius]
MDKTIKYLLLLFAALLFLHIFPMDANANMISKKRAIVLFEEKVDRQLLEDYTVDTDFVFSELPAAAVELTETQKKMLEFQPGIHSVEYDQEVQQSAQRVEWGFKAVAADKRIPNTLSGKGVKVAILDSGIDKTHPDLQVAGGACYMTILQLDGCKDSYNDDNGHGTHVAGIVAAKNNDIGVVGVAPGAQIYAVKVLNKLGDGTTSTMMAGVEWAIKNKMDIINISISSPLLDSNLQRMIQRAYNSGILVIAAAGNEGPPLTGEWSSVQYPAKFPEVIAVSSIDSNRRHGELASVGKEVELAAPGENIYSTYPTAMKTMSGAQGYETLSGTSMASPYVTGLAALYKEKYPTMTNSQIRALLQKNAIDLGEKGRDVYFGFGLAQADKTPVGEASLPYMTDGKGKIIIDASKAASQYTGFNVYRFDQLIAKNIKASEIIDYATKGDVYYYIYPVIGGQEEEAAYSVRAENPAPAVADLQTDKWYNRFVTYLYYKGVLKGYSDKMGYLLRPDQMITRGEAAIMLGRALRLEEKKPSTRFKDVTSSMASAGYIEALAEKKIITGFSDGTFRSESSVTRAEMAILIAKAYQVPAKTTGTFKDISKNVTGYQYINGLVAENIVSGYGDGTFRPGVMINRANFSTFLSKADNKQLRITY